MGRVQASIALLITVALLVACGRGSAPRPSPTPTFHESGFPQKLSDWGVISVADGHLRLSDRVFPYDLATPLFSDYAQKLRTVWLPPETSATFRAEGDFEFPIGTIITKTFYYGQTSNGAVSDEQVQLTTAGLALDKTRLIETRLMVHRAEGWVAIPYIWDADGKDASLARTGALFPLSLRRDGESSEEAAEFTYLVPNQNQCAGCHATNNTDRTLRPIGMKARHLNKTSSFQPAFNQLDLWLLAGALTSDEEIDATGLYANVNWSDASLPLNDRARSYLDINCSHCHSPVGPADTSGLNLEPDAEGAALGLCKLTIAAGSGAGGRPYGIVPGEPDESILVYRLETDEPAAMMPELGRALVHHEGAALIREWVTNLPGSCSA
ncbi:MAG: SO2930 family diheme c-type cytochrome [Pseudomonadota bacterium]